MLRATFFRKQRLRQSAAPGSVEIYSHSHSIVAGGFPRCRSDARDAAHLVDDAARHDVEEIVRQRAQSRGHEVDGLDGAQRDDVVVLRPSPNTPTDFTGRNTANAWLDCIVEALRAQLRDEDVVGAAQQIRVLFASPRRGCARRARARERMPLHELPRQAELRADPAHFVFEQIAQRLDSFRFMRSGRPPTLWCDLIRCALPVFAPADSMTSG